ncbi:hypothetical protein [Verrucomicrobium sp. BvORR034]|uniref:hypothetical protein n=1 Tax=Verrucomicrobium sp. BvORR034 TaxID=1396418 RepID=UPI000679691F|nr:hypothetical protein [Verrucomicrobium sp. BvORR034]
MNRPLLLLLILSVQVNLLSLANAEDKVAAQAKSVQEPLTAPWTKLTLGSVLLTDYGQGYAAAMEIVRDKPGAAMKCRSIQESGGVFRALSADEYKALAKVLQESAADVEKEITKSEAFAAYLKKYEKAKTEEDFEAIRDEMPRGGWDIVALYVKAEGPSGAIEYANHGHADKLMQHLASQFAIKQRKFSRAELKLLLGRDPYASL